MKAAKRFLQGLLLALIVLATPLREVLAQAPETTFVPIKAKGWLGSESTLRLETSIYKPSGEGRFPLVVLNHGSTGMGASPTSRSYRFLDLATFFLDRGFAVIVPMRKGRGKSEGSYAESEARSCDVANWPSGVNSAIEDLDGILDWATKLPYVDSSKIVLSGISRGGYLSVAYPVRGAFRANVVGVINFVGGWVSSGCPQDFNLESYSAFGAKTKLPMLWLYAENDSYYSVDAIKGYATAFLAAGGNAELKLYSGIPGNGHNLATSESAWGMDADKYLKSLHLGRSNP